MSHCEHHMAPFWGEVWIGYIPEKYVTGLDKMVKLTEVFARRLQIQERMTKQIADSMFEVLECNGVMVVIKAKHLCVVARGVQDEEALTSTIELQGVFQTPVVQQQFFELIRHQDDKLEKEV